ncbi:hypothetical protein BY996DRAFT_7831895 [Phakopsora pachyrhizi]|nr:hypothetical protein BY996DRAFT_7831895 [Phakopsora pachyrhizi]
MIMLFDRAQFKVLLSLMILVQTLQAQGIPYLRYPPIRGSNGLPSKNVPGHPHEKYSGKNRDCPMKKWFVWVLTLLLNHRFYF